MCLTSLLRVLPFCSKQIPSMVPKVFSTYLGKFPRQALIVSRSLRFNQSNNNPFPFGQVLSFILTYYTLLLPLLYTLRQLPRNYQALCLKQLGLFLHRLLLHNILSTHLAETSVNPSRALVEDANALGHTYVRSHPLMQGLGQTTLTTAKRTNQPKWW